MSVRRVVLRQAAQRDIEEAVSLYVGEGAVEAASSFLDHLEQAFGTIGTHPEAGSPRYSSELSLPGLRFWPLERFPHLIFYVVRRDEIDVWRVLHGDRDIPSWLRG